MCEFCHKHGEGKKWYLRAENYSEDLLSDLRRRRFIEEFVSEPEGLREDMEKIEKLDRAPAFVRRAGGRGVSNRQKRIHYGRVGPSEELERLLGFVKSIVRPPWG